MCITVGLPGRAETLLDPGQAGRGTSTRNFLADKKETNMPTYEYKCEACGHAFEEFQMINDKPLRTCPECKRRKLRRLIGPGAAVIFKGSGFYQTDYRSKSYSEKAKADKAESTASASSEAKSKKKSDAKPATGKTGD